jgi:hypothetical protein
MAAGFWRTTRKELVYGEQRLRLLTLSRVTSSDPLFSNVVLLMGFNGPNNSNNFVDESSYQQTITIDTGTPIISNASSKFGGTSGYFDGSSRLVAGSSANGFGDGDFCIEYFADYRGSNGYKAFWNGAGVFFGLENATTRQFVWNGSSTQLLSTTSISGSVWQHHALDRRSGTLRIFLDGILVATGPWTANLGSVFSGSIGGSAAGGQNAHVYMDELRITSGSSRYAEPFTPPTGPFPRS